MNFILGVNDTYPDERFITFTEAAEILGTGNHTRVRKLVLSGDLSAYKIPAHLNLVKKSELLLLLSPKVIKKDQAPNLARKYKLIILIG